jgi:hypothetical protein
MGNKGLDKRRDKCVKTQPEERKDWIGKKFTDVSLK